MPPFIAPLLWKAGSYALRKLGDKKGGLAGEAMSAIADVVEEAQGDSPLEASAKISGAIKRLPPEQQVEILSAQRDLERIAAEREKNRLDHEASIYAQEQETHRTEATEGTDFVKETRPRIARNSAAAGFIYVLTFELIEVIGKLCDKEISGADWEIAAALFAPCMGYMGMRTIDAFSKWKSAPGSALNTSEIKR